MSRNLKFVFYVLTDKDGFEVKGREGESAYLRQADWEELPQLIANDTTIYVELSPDENLYTDFTAEIVFLGSIFPGMKGEKRRFSEAALCFVAKSSLIS